MPAPGKRIAHVLVVWLKSAQFYFVVHVSYPVLCFTFPLDMCS